MSIGTLLERMFVSIQADLSGLTSEMRRAGNDVKKVTDDMSKRFSAVGTSMSKAGTYLSVGMTLPLAAFGKKAIETASDVEEMQAKFDTVFGSLASDVAEWSSTTAKELNRSKFDLMGYASSFQDTFVPMGFARDEASELSKSITQLGVDMASFNNKAEPEVMAALQSALVGNHETMRQFGVVITQTTLDMELMKMGIEGGVKAATEQEKIMARLNMIMKGTSDAHGDAARTADGFANQVRGMQAAVKEVTVILGQVLLPIATDVVKWIGEMAKKFQALDPETQKMVVVFGAIAAAIGPVLTVLGLMVSGLGAIISIVPAIVAAGTAIGGAIALAGGPITLIIAAIAGLVAAYVYFKDDVDAAVTAAWEVISITFTNILNKTVELKDKAIEAVTALVNAVKLWFSDKLGAILDSVTSKVEAVEGAFSWLYDKVVGNSWVPDMVDQIGDHFGRLNNEMVKPTEEATAAVSEEFKGLMDVMGNHLDTFISTGKFSLSGFAKDISSKYLREAMTNFTDTITKILQDAFSSLAGSIAGGMGGSGGGLFSALGSLFNGLFGGFRAGGGVVPPWKSFVAGERGAEMIEQDGPAGARRVTTAGRTAAGASGLGKIEVVVSGARGNAEIQDMVQQGVQQGLSLYDRSVGDRVNKNFGRRG